MEPELIEVSPNRPDFELCVLKLRELNRSGGNTVLFLCRLSTPIYCRTDDQLFFCSVFGVWKRTKIEHRESVPFFVSLFSIGSLACQIAEEKGHRKKRWRFPKNLRHSFSLLAPSRPFSPYLSILSLSLEKQATSRKYFNSEVLQLFSLYYVSC